MYGTAGRRSVFRYLFRHIGPVGVPFTRRVQAGKLKVEAVEGIWLGAVPSRIMYTVKQHAAGIRPFVQPMRGSCGRYKQKLV